VRCAAASGLKSNRTNSLAALSVFTLMESFTQGDRVRVDIPDETDHDHDQYHGLHGTVSDVIEDEAGEIIGNERAGTIFRVELENGETADFRWRDLRPPFE